MFAAPLAFRRRVRVDTERVLGDVIAVGGDEAVAARLGADAADHLRDRMHDIAVAGAAEIGEAAGDGQAARIVLGYPYLLAADLDRRGEAGIEVEEAHVADRFADRKSVV